MLFKLTIHQPDGRTKVRYGSQAEMTRQSIELDAVATLRADLAPATDAEAQSHLEALNMALHDAKFDYENSSWEMGETWRARIEGIEARIWEIKRLIAAGREGNAA